MGYLGLDDRQKRLALDLKPNPSSGKAHDGPPGAFKTTVCAECGSTTASVFVTRAKGGMICQACDLGYVVDKS